MNLKSLAFTVVSILTGIASFAFLRWVLAIAIEPNNTGFWFILLFSLFLTQFFLWIFEVENIVTYLLWICIIFASIALLLPVFELIWKLILKVLAVLLLIFITIFMSITML